MTDMTEAQADSTRRRPGRPRKADSAATSAASSRRRRRSAGDEVLQNLDAMVTQLIKENRQLQRQIDKLSRTATGAAAGASDRVLRSLHRKLSQAVNGSAQTGRRRRAAAAAATPTPRRRITDPAVLERRREALAKAREARAAKRAAQQ